MGMLLGIILSVIHCGAPIRTDLNPQQINNEQPQQQQINNNNNMEQEEEQKTNSILNTNQQRMLLRHIPGDNMAIFSNPDNWFKANPNYTPIQNEQIQNDIEHKNNIKEN